MLRSSWGERSFFAQADTFSKTSLQNFGLFGGIGAMQKLLFGAARLYKRFNRHYFGVTVAVSTLLHQSIIAVSMIE